MSKRKRPLPRYYVALSRQLLFILTNGYPEEARGVRVVITGLFRFVARRPVSPPGSHALFPASRVR